MANQKRERCFLRGKKIVVLSDQKAPTMFCYCPTSLSICPPFGIFGAFPYFIKVTHAVFSDRDKRKKVGKKDFLADRKME